MLCCDYKSLLYDHKHKPMTCKVVHICIRRGGGNGVSMKNKNYGIKKCATPSPPENVDQDSQSDFHVVVEYHHHFRRGGHNRSVEARQGEK